MSVHSSEQETIPSSLKRLLIELRSRLLRCIVAIFIVFAGLSVYANEIYHLIAMPLLQSMPNDSNMIATNVISPFFVPIKLVLMLAIFIVMPYIFYQIWAFIATALYQKEKRFIRPLLASSVILFYLGMLFAYFIVFPVVFRFMAQTLPVDIKLATDISSYLDFVLSLFFAFGLCFEVPVIIFLLCLSGISNPSKLAKQRPYIIVLAFIVGMLLTPPDVISQLLLAIPICLLFEIGLLVTKFCIKPLQKTANPDKKE